MKGRVGMNHLLSINSHPKLLPRAQTERVWHLTIFASSFSPFFFSPPRPLLFLLLARTSSKSAGEKKKKKNLFSLYFWIWAQVCEGFGKDLQTFERIRVEIWGNPPPSLKKQVALARNWAKIGCFNWGFLWDFGFEPEAALWESNVALTDSIFTGTNTSPSELMLSAQRGVELAPSESLCDPNQKRKEDPDQSAEQSRFPPTCCCGSAH